MAVKFFNSHFLYKFYKLHSWICTRPFVSVSGSITVICMIKMVGIRFLKSI